MIFPTDENDARIGDNNDACSRRRKRRSSALTGAENVVSKERGQTGSNTWALRAFVSLVRRSGLHRRFHRSSIDIPPNAAQQKHMLLSSAVVVGAPHHRNPEHERRRP